MTSRGVKKEVSPPKKVSTRTYRKSPARTETRTSSKAIEKAVSKPELRKSPSRTTASKSPVRKSPSRKSPSRRTTTVPEKPKRSARSSKPVIDLEFDSEDSDTNYYVKLTSEKPKATVRGRARKLITETSSKNPASVIQDVTPAQEMQTYIGATRRSISRLQQAQAVDRIDPIRHESLRPVIQKLTELSDEDDIKLEVKEKSKTRSVSRLMDQKIITSNSGWFASCLQIILSTLFPVGYFTFCNEDQCEFTKLPNLSKFLHWSTFFNTTAFAMSLSYVLFVLLLSAIAFGYKVSGLPNKQGKLEYLINGLLVAVSTVTVVLIMECSKVPVADYIISNYFQLLISLIIIGIVVSIGLYIKSFYVPLTALKSDVLTNNEVYNYLKGRELNPRLFRVDLKLYLCRLFAIGVILINGILLYKDIQIGWSKDGLDLKSTKCNLTLVIAAIIQIIYVVDFIIYESAFVTTASAQYDAVGYETVVFFSCGCLVMCAGPKYIYDYGVKLPFWYLAIVVQLFVFGYLLYRMSNNQKHAFRENPYHPSFSNLDTLATSQGKKLLVSGSWGWIRHPNYLGDIIIHAAFALLVYNAVPVLIYLVNIAIILQRSHEDGVRCKQRYGYAWDRYCELVKYVLIPKIY